MVPERALECCNSKNNDDIANALSGIIGKLPGVSFDLFS